MNPSDQMKPFPKSDILEVYQNHPLQERTILARVLEQKGTLEGITEFDLAQDRHTGVTDQNHVGGVRFVKELAERAGVTAQTKILDLGSGLGGSARCLAALFGCQVRGIDFSEKRWEEACNLTKLVGLDRLVDFQCQDFLTMSVPTRQFDVLWGQGAWLHIENKRQFINRWGASLRQGGRVAFEESHVKRPIPESLKHLLEQLSECWKAHFVRLEDWVEILDAEGFQITVQEDLTAEFVQYFTRRVELAGKLGLTDIPTNERRGWESAARLGEAGVLGFARIVAQKMS